MVKNETSVKSFFSNWGNLAALLLLLLSIAVFSFTTNLQYYFVIAVPFALVFISWLVLNWKSYYWFFLATFALTLVLPISGNLVYIPLMPLSIISAVLALALLLFNQKSIYQNFLRHPITLILFLQFFWLFVSVVFSQIPILSIKYMGVNVIQLLAFLFFPMLVIKEEKDWIVVIKILLFTFTPVALYILFRHALHNYSYTYTNISIKPFFFNHVDHGCIMSMLIPLPYILWRNTNKQKKWLRGFYLLLLAFFIVCTYLSFARAAMLGMAFSFVVLFAIRKRMVNKLMLLFFATIISLSIYLVQDDNYKHFRPDFEQTYSRHTFDDLLKATFVGGDMSSAERFYRWIAAARMSEERPLTGVGPNNFYYYYKPHAVQMFRTYVSRNEEKSTTHNYFIFMLVEQGWPAMLLYGSLIWALFNWAQKAYHQSKKLLHQRMALLAAMVIAAFFINNLFSELLQTYKIGAIFYLAVVLIYWVDNENRKQKKVELS